MRWPIHITFGGGPAVPPEPALPIPARPDRPSTVIGFLWDLSLNPKQAFVFVIMIGAIAVIVTACIVGASYGVAAAAKGVKGVPLRYIWSLGLPAASLVTLVTTMVRRWIRRPKALPGGGSSGKNPDGSSS
jgi:hypothetical protein